jgi:CRP/FNR family cyclic AMP-dependent transcriptional regulator
VVVGTREPKSASSDIQLLLEQSKLRAVPAGTAIVRENETPNELFYIRKGSVAVTTQDEDGRELILTFLGPGEFFGELGLFGDECRRSATVRTRVDSELAVIDYERFRTLCRANPDLLLTLTGQIASRLRATSRKMVHLAFLDVTGRIARTLLDLAHDSQAITHPDGMMIRMTREELGRMVSCSREMAGRVLHYLEEQGLVQVSGKSIVVLTASLSEQN